MSWLAGLEPVLSPMLLWGVTAVVVVIAFTLGALAVIVFGIETIDDYKRNGW